MLERYEPQEFEAKWRTRWEEAELFKTVMEPGRPKFYGLDFFPYPSGAGLSVGHCRNYIPTDVLCRMKVMQGYNVLHPMGFDAFGLPAENEAIKNKTHPGPMIDRYAANYKRQMDLVGISYDWSRSFKSCEPSYYRWTQWIFELLYKRGLAYRKDAEVNWCPKDKTALANEEVVAGLCERCGTPVEKKAIPQWYFRITDYAQRLIDDLEDIDWPEGIKAMQRNWIGRSEGVQFKFKVEKAEPSGSETDFEIVQKSDLSFEVYTTRIDTVFGVSFCVLSPEHPLVESLKNTATDEIRSAITEYQAAAKRETESTRMAEGREKTGVFSGSFAMNPLSGNKIPIWIADYVLMGYGTGAIMAVPGHDQRDFDFAKKFGLPILPVIAPAPNDVESIRLFHEKGEAFESKDGFLVNSGTYTGKSVADAQNQLGAWIEESDLGSRKVQYRLRDWLISRQRYWGCPIPVCYDKEGQIDLIPKDQLPVELPVVESYEPSDDGSSPLSAMTEFVNCTTPDGSLGTRETDTMGGFACSSWYFLRFCDPHNFERAWDPEIVKYWMPVDCYVGGAEHAVMHLLYARFWTKVLYDEGLIDVHEPFKRLKNQGQVLGKTPFRSPRKDEQLPVGEDGILMSYAEAAQMPEDEVTWKWVRMSKSKGNVVTPDEAVEAYGADALRLFELFVAPFDSDVEWTNDGMNGTARFLSRVIRFVHDNQDRYDQEWRKKISGQSVGNAKDFRRESHKAIKKVTEDIERFAFNTAVSALMEAMNGLTSISKNCQWNEAECLAVSEAIDTMILLLAPMAPHTADELWETLGHNGFTYQASWPQFDPTLATEDQLTIAVQVNGKLRDTVLVPADCDQQTQESTALSSEKVQQFLSGQSIVKVIVVPGKLVNIVAK